MSEDLSVLSGRDVLVVDDLINSGTTLHKFCRRLTEYEPKSLKVACLIEKRTSKFKADFAGFTVPNAFVVGFCLDYNEAFRDLEHVAVISNAAVDKYSA
ncbi:hypoxanthine phosphoribosyltransferase 1 [Perkinsus olseni]|uniref:Hypoxanthine phosphoribosyltransferase 1 n=1 Tax=Perkinsus olseni TaxID=32597 RepID=A0A7J6RTF9_PEROL|nr:hypoxanthine phosphoribosyltransferase 1 [Perkinsus olseni]KAF4723040.1 hypoxanthine phosphoribosyltransferase 1 [Perkinsus olseni]